MEKAFTHFGSSGRRIVTKELQDIQWLQFALGIDGYFKYNSEKFFLSVHGFTKVFSSIFLINEYLSNPWEDHDRLLGGVKLLLDACVFYGLVYLNHIHDLLERFFSETASNEDDGLRQLQPVGIVGTGLRLADDLSHHGRDGAYSQGFRVTQQALWISFHHELAFLQLIEDEWVVQDLLGADLWEELDAGTFCLNHSWYLDTLFDSFSNAIQLFHCILYVMLVTSKSGLSGELLDTRFTEHQRCSTEGDNGLFLASLSIFFHSVISINQF